MSFNEKVYQILLDNNVNIDGEIDFYSAEPQRFRVKHTWGGGRKKPLFVIIHGEGVSFGDWRDPSTWKTWWAKTWQQISYEERELRKEQMEILAYQRVLIQNHAAWRARELLTHKTWRGDTCFAASQHHPYVVKKKIFPHFAYQIRSCLVIPITDVDRNLQSLQFIKSNMRKQFKKNAKIKGGMVWLCDPLPDDYTGVLRLCEGWATGCTIRSITSSPVVCAMSASNLAAVSVAIREKYKDINLKTCADNDKWQDENIGLEEASKVDRIANSPIYWPEFNGFDESKKPTDFNDLFCLAGHEETKRQLILLRV